MHRDEGGRSPDLSRHPARGRTQGRGQLDAGEAHHAAGRDGSAAKIGRTCATDFAPVRGGPAEHPAAGDRRPDLAFRRDMEYLPLFHLHVGTAHWIVEYGLFFHFQMTQEGCEVENRWHFPLARVALPPPCPVAPQAPGWCTRMWAAGRQTCRITRRASGLRDEGGSPQARRTTPPAGMDRRPKPVGLAPRCTSSSSHKVCHRCWPFKFFMLPPPGHSRRGISARWR